MVPVRVAVTGAAGHGDAPIQSEVLGDGPHLADGPERLLLGTGLGMPRLRAILGEVPRARAALRDVVGAGELARQQALHQRTIADQTDLALGAQWPDLELDRPEQ